MRVAEPAQKLALMAVDTDPRPAIRHVDVDRHVGPDLADIKSTVLARLHVQPRRPMHVDPLSLVFAVAVEHLDPVIFPVGDVDPAVAVAADVVRDVELAGIGAGLAPGEQELAVRAEFMDPRIAVAVRDVEIALRREGGVGAAVERLAAHIGRRLSGNAEGLQHLSVERALPHRMVAVIGQPERFVRRHEDAMRPHEDALAPAAQQIAVAVEDAHRMLAAVEGIDIVVLVDADRRDIGVEFVAGRQFRPALGNLVPVPLRAQHDRHALSSSTAGIMAHDFI